LHGGFTGTVSSGGSWSGSLTLAPTSAGFLVFGFIPVTAALNLVPVAPATGTLVNGALTGHVNLNVVVPSVKLLSLPIGGGAGCQTTSPVSIDLHSTGTFSAATGGSLAGSYVMPPLANCGLFTSMFNSVIAGPGNTLAVTLAP